MDLQEAIIQVVEEWREKRGMTKIQVGMAIFLQAQNPVLLETNGITL